MPTATLRDLLTEYDRALAYTEDLQVGLTSDQIAWRPTPNSSGIGWHLGHQAAVAHFMLRNLTAAEARIDPDIEALMDSATPEIDRGELPSLERIRDYRGIVADRVRYRIRQIDDGNVSAPKQLRVIASTLLVAMVNHEYQHSKWIEEVRSGVFGLQAPPLPTSPRLDVVEGYVVVTDAA